MTRNGRVLREPSSTGPSEHPPPSSARPGHLSITGSLGAITRDRDPAPPLRLRPRRRRALLLLPRLFPMVHPQHPNHAAFVHPLSLQTTLNTAMRAMGRAARDASVSQTYTKDLRGKRKHFAFS